MGRQENIEIFENTMSMCRTDSVSEIGDKGIKQWTVSDTGG